MGASSCRSGEDLGGDSSGCLPCWALKDHTGVLENRSKAALDWSNGTNSKRDRGTVLLPWGCCDPSPLSGWLRTVEVYSLTVWSRESKIRVSAGPRSPRRPQERILPGLFHVRGGCWPSLAFLGLWRRHSKLCPRHHKAVFPLCLRLCLFS